MVRAHTASAIRSYDKRTCYWRKLGFLHLLLEKALTTTHSPGSLLRIRFGQLVTIDKAAESHLRNTFHHFNSTVSQMDEEGMKLLKSRARAPLISELCSVGSEIRALLHQWKWVQNTAFYALAASETEQLGITSFPVRYISVWVFIFLFIS